MGAVMYFGVSGLENGRPLLDFVGRLEWLGPDFRKF